MILEIFDVEHGACALITTSGGKHILIDCGDNTSTGWEPGTALRARGITSLERLIVTNYDEDHASGFANLYRNVAIFGLQRNAQVSAELLHHLKREDGMGTGIANLAGVFSNFNGPPLPAVVDDVTIAAFSNQPGVPPFGFGDENNLSLAVFVSCGVHRIIFPGDMVKAVGARSCKTHGFCSSSRASRSSSLPTMAARMGTARTRSTSAPTSR